MSETPVVDTRRVLHRRPTPGEQWTKSFSFRIQLDDGQWISIQQQASRNPCHGQPSEPYEWQCSREHVGVGVRVQGRVMDGSVRARCAVVRHVCAPGVRLAGVRRDRVVERGCSCRRVGPWGSEKGGEFFHTRSRRCSRLPVRIP